MDQTKQSAELDDDDDNEVLKRLQVIKSKRIQRNNIIEEDRSMKAV